MDQCDHCEGERTIKIPADQVLTQGRRIDIYLRKDNGGILLALPVEGKLFLVGLWTGMKEKTLTRSIAPHWVSGDLLICLSNKTTSGTAASIGITTWFNLP